MTSRVGELAAVPREQASSEKERTRLVPNRAVSFMLFFVPLMMIILQGCSSADDDDKPSEQQASSGAFERQNETRTNDVHHDFSGSPSPLFSSNLRPGSSSGSNTTQPGADASSTSTSSSLIGTPSITAPALRSTASPSTTGRPPSGTSEPVESFPPPVGPVELGETTPSPVGPSPAPDGPATPKEFRPILAVAENVSQFRNCYLAVPLISEFGCTRLSTKTGGRFRRNEHGQETTAKRKCLEQARRLGGDTFVFEVGLCEVWSCGTRDTLRASANPIQWWSSDASLVSLKSFHGKYLSVHSDHVVGGDASMAAPNALFEFTTNADDTVSFRTQSGYVSRQTGGKLTATAQQIGVHERFALIDNGDGTVSLKSHTGTYMTAFDNDEVTAKATQILGWERFHLTQQSAPSLSEQETSRERRAGVGAEVYSELCEFQEASGGRGGAERRTFIAVKLWEWNYADIGRECQQYLGPNGFDAVQLSPIAEHRLGTHWWSKYQPISFGLDTRSGTAAELRQMVKDCRAAGVQVMVDLILNHMGGACQDAYGNDDPVPCHGWGGSRYGLRQMQGAHGWDAATQEYFRHREGQPWEGVCGVGPPSFLCGSTVTTDCSCCECDLYGLPDWNTNLQQVQDIHSRFIEELHDIGITMLRVDAALYEDVGQTSRVLNRVPWDYVYLEWWGEYPVGIHDKYIGNYRDVAFRWKICNYLAGERDMEKMDGILDLTFGTFGVNSEKAIYPIAYHDGRTNTADQHIATYKNGLEYHQQQKFLMVWPKSERILLWGGFGWDNTEQGPPGCEGEGERCTPESVFNQDGSSRCLPTPIQSPMPEEQAQSHRWICEHRWTGVAGLVAFRRACQGLPVTRLSEPGNGTVAFRVGEECFVGIVHGFNSKWPAAQPRVGDWNLAGFATGMREGRYCDVSSLDAKLQSTATSCPREVLIDSDGVIVSGTVPEGDLVAIYGGSRLGDE